MLRVESADMDRCRMYWGQGPFPHGCDFLGIVWMGDGTRIENGALFQNEQGRFFAGNAGVLKALPTRETAKALSDAVMP